MPPVQILNAAELPSDQLEDWGLVSVPLGEQVSRLRGKILAANDDGSEAGIWECTPGIWQRQVKDAELCTFLSGHAIFTPEGGDAIELRAGSVAFFPANSRGVWNVFETARKSYLTYPPR